MSQRSLVANAADEEQVENARVVSKDRQKQADEDLVTVLETPAGRRWMWAFLSECGIFKDIPLDNHAVMAGMVRERSVGLRVLKEIERVCPAMFDKMREESRNAAR
jgi:hypothetical protein